MPKLFTGDIEYVMNNRIILFKDGEEYAYCVVADYNPETATYTVVPIKDAIGVSGERRSYETKEVYLP